ncbi:MAG: 50S ribosomal protein L37ae [Methanomicrobia archaeon]|nr:50S ribosomal protein L37ae [Methanomicrobia archaeon]
MVRKQKRKKGKKTKSAGRFGVRYGRKIRKAITAIEDRTRAAHTCPRCERPAVKRIGTGIWKCAKCGYTFTGGTYVPHTPLGITAQRTIKRLGERGAEISLEGSEQNAEAESVVSAGGE